jgi:hypothetical protein
VNQSELSLIEEGYAALRRGDSAGARRAFTSSSVEADRGTILEGTARADYLDHEYPSAIEGWCSAYEAYRREGDGVGAIRVARTLAYMYMSVVGDPAVGGGWFARALSLLADEGPCVESGWISLHQGMFEPDRIVKEARFRAALDVARDMGDSSLEFATLAYLGASLVNDDRVDEGMTLLDEALAAVAGRDVDDFCIVEEIFCQLFSACEHAHDVGRADQWIRVGEDIAVRRNLPAVAAFCRTHYGGLLTAAGRWGEADDALTDAVRLWGLGHSSLRPGALTRLADLRVRQGRFEEAEQLLDGLEDNADAVRPMATVHLTRGDTELAIDLVERAINDIDPTSVAAAPLWAVLVEAHLADGNHDAATTAVEMLDACASHHSSAYLLATLALARGRLYLAVANADGYARLRAASTGFAKARTPMEEAQARFELATALAPERPKVALAEARAALQGFERLPASRHADAVAALLRSLGVRDRPLPRQEGVLTKREDQPPRRSPTAPPANR